MCLCCCCLVAGRALGCLCCFWLASGSWLWWVVVPMVGACPFLSACSGCGLACDMWLGLVSLLVSAVALESVGAGIGPSAHSCPSMCDAGCAFWAWQAERGPCPHAARYRYGCDCVGSERIPEACREYPSPSSARPLLPFITSQITSHHPRALPWLPVATSVHCRRCQSSPPRTDMTSPPMTRPPP